MLLLMMKQQHILEDTCGNENDNNDGYHESGDKIELLLMIDEGEMKW